MPEVYDFGPPNEDANGEVLYYLHEVRCENCMFLTLDQFWKSSPGNIVRPQIFDAWLLEDMLHNDKEVIAALEELDALGWFATKLGKLRTAVANCCARYADTNNQREQAAALDFYTKHPGYDGLFRSFQNYDDWFERGGLVQADDKWRLKLRLVFDRLSPLIVKWCCNTFHYSRGMWGFTKVFEPVKLESYKPDENVPTPRHLRTAEDKVKKPSAKERRAVELAAMTPEQRRLAIISDKLKKSVAALSRSGKVDEVTLFDLGLR